MADTELQDWIRLASSITDDDRDRVAPPPDLWIRIEAGLGETTAPTATSETIIEDDEELPFEQPMVIDLDQERTRRAPRSRRRTRRRLTMAAAAAAVVAVLGVSTMIGQDDTTTWVAEATNLDLPEAYEGTATATVDGEEISLDFSNQLPTGEPIELWLIKPDLSDMVSLGLVDDAGAYVVPEGIDVSEYSLVDLSIEPDDGDPTHSGRSILRGQLQST